MYTHTFSNFLKWNNSVYKNMKIAKKLLKNVVSITDAAIVEKTTRAALNEEILYLDELN